MTTPHNIRIIDKVAEAIYQAECKTRHLSVKRDVYRRMAQAAIDAMKLEETEQTLCQCQHWDWQHSYGGCTLCSCHAMVWGSK